MSREKLTNVVAGDYDSASGSPLASINNGSGSGPATAVKCFTPLRLLVVFTIVNVLNYVDRGIVAGAGTSIKGCNSSCSSATDFCWYNVSGRACDNHYYREYCSAREHTCQQQFTADVLMCGDLEASGNCSNPHNLTACPVCCRNQYGFGIDEEDLGWVQFSFLIGYMPSMLIFGHLVTKHKPFVLMGTGLTIWCVAVLASGFAGPVFLDNYFTLLVARAVSGVGEASFQCIGPPFIDDYAPKAQKGLWLAVFYSAIPCGTALGFVWAGTVADALSWEYAYILECPVMLPVALMCFFIPLDLKSKVGGHGHGMSSTDDNDRGHGESAAAAGARAAGSSNSRNGALAISSARPPHSLSARASPRGKYPAASVGDDGEEILVGLGSSNGFSASDVDCDDDDASHDPYVRLFKSSRVAVVQCALKGVQKQTENNNCAVLLNEQVRRRERRRRRGQRRRHARRAGRKHLSLERPR
jgi:hypothetical protein